MNNLYRKTDKLMSIPHFYWISYRFLKQFLFTKRNFFIKNAAVILFVFLGFKLLIASDSQKLSRAETNNNQSSTPNPNSSLKSTASFRGEVMAILARGGCNQGACHGNLNGKGGFKLSLRGEDSDFDYSILTRDLQSRRVSLQNPENSLLLLKATGQVAHEGGVRFSKGSREYKTILQWIRSNCPKEIKNDFKPVKLEVVPDRQILFDPQNSIRLNAYIYDQRGQKKNINHLVVWEANNVGIADISADGLVKRQQFGEVVVVVRYLNFQIPIRIQFVSAKKDFIWQPRKIKNPIDQIIFAQLKELKLSPASVCDDATFIRRAYLDAIGVIPSSEEVREFLSDSRIDKRDQMIARLVDRPEFADFWASKWSDLLRNEEKTLDHKGVQVFYQWIRESIKQDYPLNEFARDLIAGQGSSYENPPSNFYRALRATYDRSEAVAQVFLGIRLQCAKCHNHPFEKWTQDEYHQFASFFNQIDYRIVANGRKDKFDKHEFRGEQIVYSDTKKQLKHPRTGEILIPQLLGVKKEPDLNKSSKEQVLASLSTEKISSVQIVADWIADPANPYFAKAQANRIWYHLLHRGVVDPIDDFRITNPAINKELLEFLEKEFRDHHFSLKHLVRLIMSSQVYQLKIPSLEDRELQDYLSRNNLEEDSHFAHALIRPIPAEALLDSLAKITGMKPSFPGFPSSLRSNQLPAINLKIRGRASNDLSTRFLQTFGKPNRLLSCECERSDDPGLIQAFQLISGDLINQWITKKDNELHRLMNRTTSNTQFIQEIYLRVLSRPATEKEEASLLQLLEKRESDRIAFFEDLVWGLVNSKEFRLRH